MEVGIADNWELLPGGISTTRGSLLPGLEWAAACWREG